MANPNENSSWQKMLLKVETIIKKDSTVNKNENNSDREPEN